jgi:two-component system chemotaxis response regulator CheB
MDSRIGNNPTTTCNVRPGTVEVLAIGASTGGTEAIKAILAALPADMPPLVLVQHMPAAFTPSFARRLDASGPIAVVEVSGRERLLRGHAYLAPGSAHLRIRKSEEGYFAELQDGPPVNRHRPAVDVLFRSMAEQVGHRAIGIILTGMGKDGALGLLAMHDAGAWTIGQDQASCVVYGMPREAALCGAVDEVVALGQIPERILARLQLSR